MEINTSALQAIRLRSGMTRAVLAQAAGIDRATVANIEDGRRKASPATVVAIAQALKVDIPAIIHPATDTVVDGGGDPARSPEAVES